MFRRLLAALVIVGASQTAHAEVIAGSLAQVGAWRVGAYTSAQMRDFSHCALNRVQANGFGLAVGLTVRGIWSLALEAPDWGLTPNETYTTTIFAGPAGPYTFSGRAVNPRTMALNVSAELFPKLKSGAQFSADANGKHYTMSLDGIEAAAARVKECVRQYSPASVARGDNPAPPIPPSSPTAERGPGNLAKQPDKLVETDKGKPAAIVSGTGFFISGNVVITNNHVVDGCVEIRARKHGAEIGTLRLMAASRGDDLAALRAEKPAEQYLKLRVGDPIRSAESILVFGYPLVGALSSSGNTTLGNVTALTGLADDSRYIQISASIQPGNSGGPVLDEDGRLVGVIEGKLDALRIAKVTGDIPQNVNFAIRASTLATFLEANRIAYEVNGNSTTLRNTQLAEQAEAVSVQLECRK